MCGQGKLTVQTATKVLRGKCRQIIPRGERDGGAGVGGASTNTTLSILICPACRRGC